MQHKRCTPQARAYSEGMSKTKWVASTNTALVRCGTLADVAKLDGAIVFRICECGCDREAGKAYGHVVRGKVIRNEGAMR